MKGLNRRNTATNIRTCNRGSVGDAALNPDTRDWISRVNVAGSGALHYNQIKVHNFVEQNYKTGLRNAAGTAHKITYCLPINKVTSLDGSVVPLWAPSGVGNATLNNFVAGDWSATNGITGNGSTKYLDTGFTPSSHISADDKGSFLLWEAARATVTTGTPTHGCKSAANQSYLLYYSNSNTSHGFECYYSDAETATDAAQYFAYGYQPGLTQVWKNGSTWKGLRNNSFLVVKTGITNQGTRPTKSFALFASNNTSAVENYNNGSVKLLQLGEDLSDALQEAQYQLAVFLDGNVGKPKQKGFPVVVGSPTTGVSSTSDSTSYAANLPSGIVAGELLVVVVSSDGNPTLSAPTDWIKIGQASNTTVVTGAVFWKIADGTEGSTVSISSTVSEQYSSISYRIENAAYCFGTSANGSSTNSNPPSLTPNSGTQDYLWIATRSGDSTVVATVAPTDFTNLQTRAGGGTSGASTNTAVRSLNASTLDPGTFTSATEQWVSWTLAVI